MKCIQNNNIKHKTKTNNRNVIKTQQNYKK